MYRFFILISFFLYSCTKEGGNISVEGRVYNPLTGEGAEGIEVKLIRDKVGGAPGAQSAGTTAEDISVTDENGLYSLNGVLGREVRYYVDGNKYHSIGVGNNSITGDPTYSGRIGLKSGKHNKVDFWVVPYGEITFRMENVNCEGIGDTLIYRKRHQYSSSFSSWSPKWIYTGCTNIQPAQQGSKEPMGWHIFEFKVIRSSGITQFLDSVYVAENQLSIFEVYY